MNAIIEQPKIKTLALTSSPTYNLYIQDFNRYLGDRELTFEIISDYISSLKEKYAPKTIEVIKSALKKAIKASIGKSGRDILFLSALDMSFKEIRTGKTDRKIYAEKVLSSQEIDILISYMPERLALITRVLSVSGIRVSELCGIKKSDCRVAGKVVYVNIIGKGNKQRRIFLPTKLVKKIDSVFNGDAYLFETIHKKQFSRFYLWREIKKHSKNILDRDISPHCLRHSFCTNILLEKEKSLTSISNYVGHSSTAVTADMYIHDQLKPEDLF